MAKLTVTTSGGFVGIARSYVLDPVPAELLAKVEAVGRAPQADITPGPTPQTTIAWENDGDGPAPFTRRFDFHTLTDEAREITNRVMEQGVAVRPARQAGQGGGAVGR